MKKNNHNGKIKSAFISLLNPLSDIRYLNERMIKPTKRNIKRLTNDLPLLKDNQDNYKPSWSEAVAASGKNVKELSLRYQILRSIWWIIMLSCGVLSITLSLMLLISGYSLHLVTLLRAITADLFLFSFGALGAAKTLISTYRLWQLHEKRVSKEERGTFKDFLSDVNITLWVLWPVYYGEKRT